MKTPNILIALMMAAACVDSYAGSDAIYAPSAKGLTTLNEMKGLLKSKIKAGEKPSGFIKSGRFYYHPVGIFVKLFSYLYNLLVL